MGLTAASEYVVTNLMTGEQIVRGSAAEVEHFTVKTGFEKVDAYLVEPSEDAANVSLELEQWSEYFIEGDYVMGIPAKTQKDSFVSNFKYYEYLTFVDAAGVAIKDTDIVGTGSQVRLFPNSVENAKTVISFGDLNGDGKITSIDYLRIKKAFSNLYKLSDIEFLAADINRDGKITSIDYIKVKKSFSNKTTL